VLRMSKLSILAIALDILEGRLGKTGPKLFNRSWLISLSIESSGDI